MPTNGLFTPGEVLTAGNTNALLTRGYGNRIINGNFVINQRVYTSGTNLASGVYGFDRWRSGFTNTSLTFTAGSQSTTVTISASGVLQQVIERENMPAGTYTLSWSGTATGRIYNVGATPPAYGASPRIVTLDGSANVMVEFTASGGTRTLSLVQVEGGNVFSPFQYRHRAEELALCYRYYEKSYELGTALGTVTTINSSYIIYGTFTGVHQGSAQFYATKRVLPTVRAYSPITGTIDRIHLNGFGDTNYGNTAIGSNRITLGAGTLTASGVLYHYTADSEI